MLPEHLFDAGPVRINYVEGPPSGPPLLLLHGLSQRWQAFLPIIPAMSHVWHIYAPDFRGHGKSGHLPNAYRGDDYSADIATLIKDRIGQPVGIYGHSLGGMIAIHLAATYPQLVKAVAIGDSPIKTETIEGSLYPKLFATLVPLLRDNRTPLQLANAIGDTWIDTPVADRAQIKDLPGNDEAFLRWWAQGLLHLDPQVLEMSADGRAGQHWKGFEYFHSIKCPVMFLQADPARGAVLTDQEIAEAKSILPDVTHVRLNGIGHSLQMFQAAPLIRALSNFFGATCRDYVPGF